MFKRHIQKKLQKALDSTPVILLTGARQTGKTTLIRQIAQHRGAYYTTFDDYTELALAKNDPVGYINRIQKPVILDEIQRIPELFLAIKKEVDENRQPGRYALTGSANPLLIPKVGDSLAGRMEIIPLYPLSAGELRGQKEHWIQRVFSPVFDLSSHFLMDMQAFWQQVVTGGYPEMVERQADPERMQAWCRSYITTLLERDVQDLARIEGLSVLPNLLRLLASRTAGLINHADVSRSIGLSSSTVQRYLELFRAIYFIYFLPAWFTNHGKRITKMPKIHLLDSGLLCFLLGLNTDGLMIQPHLAGAILESYVVGEILKQESWGTEWIRLYHFRSDPHEVDLVLENASGQIVGVEIKCAAMIQPQDFKGLEALKKIAQDRFLRGIVLYTGDKTVPYQDDLFALSISSLWT